jgi:hypothetical protein
MPMRMWVEGTAVRYLDLRSRTQSLQGSVLNLLTSPLAPSDCINFVK